MFLNARNQGRKFQIEKHPKNKIKAKATKGEYSFKLGD